MGRNSSNASANESATVTSKVFEIYFRQLNIHLSQQKRQEADLNQVKSLALALNEKVQALWQQLQSGTSMNCPQELQAIAALKQEEESLKKQVLRFKQMALPSETQVHEILGSSQQLLDNCHTEVMQEMNRRTTQRHQLLNEAKALAQGSVDESSAKRLEELKEAWKKLGGAGSSQDSQGQLLFENVTQICSTRLKNNDLSLDSTQIQKSVALRQELLLALDALAKLQPGTVDLGHLPYSEEELARAAGKLLELGLKYKQIVALDPKSGTLKEVKSIMNQWSQLVLPESEMSPAYWECYFNRVSWLLRL